MTAHPHPPSLPPLRAALIGAGQVARAMHIPAHLALSGSRLQTIVDRDMDAARQLAERHGIPDATDRYERVLADPTIDWVDIATPNATHLPLALEALEAGKHVLVQKPMAPTAAEARRMLEAARRHKRHLDVFMCFRGDSAIRALGGLLADGAFGRLISLRGKMVSASARTAPPSGWRQREQSGGLLQLGIHMLDLLELLGGRARWIAAHTARGFSASDGDDAAFVWLGLEGDATAVLETEYCAYVTPETPLYTLEINGTHGHARYRLETGALEIRLADEAPVGAYTCPGGGAAAHLTFAHTLGGAAMSVMHQQFADRLHGAPDYSGALAGIRALELLEAIQSAASSGSRIQLEA
ncbi:Gfo/Idh/MocA family oxidoreductase [Paenibacillus sp. IB182496]|uniref:Gfo/Idh/MocA family oxidoreductase n=1 Tax=Paenibacillus sabuli TaxID=2772509 RepID=A0A927BPS1_9BACL|nr:Gfo/Idh/MocA family oxidoreductase [Paenibacillus sabuli]MBD2844027.1 Gfo/Idh/MocA family oxidoreductase [Paenibacillus sabuli]